MNEQEKHAASQEERKEKIRARYKGVDRSELEFIPAKQKEKLFEDAGIKRVCAYCRVSTDDANQTSSYELQKNHYEDMIKEHAGWTLVGIYADEGISGTSLQHRDEFNRMIENCKVGKIDLIVTKSVSRFARNIVDCIAKVRELANMKPQVGVFFETEHIYTLDNTSEMMLAVLSAAAQEESHTKSEIMNISIEQRFSRGIFLTPKLLGYDKDEDGNLVINESEADTVRLCYYLFLSGFPTSEIAEILMDLGRKTKLGNTKWTGSTVVNVLRNERHCGDVLSRKTFTPNYLDHKSKKNNHDRNQYRQTDHHEAIVSREIYNAAQKMLDASKYMKKGYPLPTLQVVDQGALKGFVPVNRAWNGFSSADYEKASLSAYSENNNEICAEKTENRGFDLSGYEIVRAQFFSTRFDPAVDLERFDYSRRFEYRKEIRKKYGLSEKDFVFGFVGRITRDKGVNELLHAFSKIKNAKLLMVGEAEGASTLKQQLYTSSLTNPNIVYTGQVFDVEKYYAAIDVLVLPSYREGFGNVIIEAAAMGTPAIVSNIPGPIDAVKVGETAQVVEPRSTESLLKAMKQFQTMDYLAMGEQAERFAREKFDSTMLCRKILERKENINVKRRTLYKKKGSTL